MHEYITLFKYYKQLGEKAMHQLGEESQFFWSPGGDSNSIAVIVQHLHGNMKSRWTDFLTTDGEKDWRNRDQEFELYCNYKEEVLRLWEQGWDCVFEGLNTVNESNRDQLVYIRNKGHSIDEAVQRQLAHYAYHVGQIVYLSRMLVGEGFESLSIAKGKSKEFNQEAKALGQRKEHFTTQLIDKPNDISE